MRITANEASMVNEDGMLNKEHYPEIRCHADSWVDRRRREIKASDSWADSHGMKHIVGFVNI